MQPIKLFTRLAVCLISLTLSGLIGCDHEVADAVVVQVDGIDRLPPQQIKKALGQLSATDARQQSQGLAFV